MTRLGLNLESFKKAPGTTAGHIVHGNADPEKLDSECRSRCKLEGTRVTSDTRASVDTGPRPPSLCCHLPAFLIPGSVS